MQEPGMIDATCVRQWKAAKIGRGIREMGRPLCALSLLQTPLA